ncbi:MAG: NTP transferase domain-containing protein [Ignavibacteria bacterium]|nr:NTP transferase domain-containing protein [Ignavibacteria bacterium]
MKAMILAAGFGTRLKPFTETHPKALIPYHGKPMILHQIERLKKAGVDEIIVNAHHFSEQIIDYFSNNRFGIKGSVITEEEILGTGGGVLNAKELLMGGGSFIVINVDVDTDMNLNRMLIHHESVSPLATIAVQKRKSGRYLEFTADMRLKSRQNDESAEKNLFAFNGIHVISDEFLGMGFREGFSDILNLYFDAIKEKEHFISGYDAGDCMFKDLGKTENLLS